MSKLYLMKKILIISDYKTGGAGGVAKLSGEILESHGYEVNYLWGCEHFKFKPLRYLYNSKARRLIRIKLQEIEPDIVIIHNFDNLFSPAILIEIKKWKRHNLVDVLMTVHDYHIVSASNSLSYYEENRKRLFSSPPCFSTLIKLKIDRRGYFFGLARICQWYFYYPVLKAEKVIDFFLCPSWFMYEMVCYRIIENKVRLIRNPSQFDSESHIRLNSDTEYLILSFVGRVSEEKGIFQFLDSLSNAYGDSQTKLEINLVGDGEKLEDVIELVSSFPASLRVNIHGKRDSNFVKETLSRSDYILLPSICYENSPLALVEGVFCGCRIVTMNYGGMKEIAEKVPGSILLNDLTTKELNRMLDLIRKNDAFDRGVISSFISDYSQEVYLKEILELINRERIGAN